MRPLDGIRVLDLTRLLPGAYATLLLADLGADVIKIEDPKGGDSGRRIGAKFEVLNRNKRSVTVNLRAPESAHVLDALIRRSDVLVDSFRPSTAQRLGVDADVLRARHPRLICASMTGFGRTAPLAERAAHDINYEALAGLLRPPALPVALIADVGAAMQTAIGILAALIQRGRDGVGSRVDVSLHDAATAWSMFPTTSDLAGPSYMLYETADRQWLALGALEPKFWRRFCERLGRPDLAALQHADGPERDRVLREIREAMLTRSRDEWLAHFADDDVCLTTVLTRDEALASSQTVARGLVARRNGVTYVTARGVEVRPAPELGRDTDAVLEEAGVDRRDIARYRTAGVI